jgi:hypothetical protein
MVPGLAKQSFEEQDNEILVFIRLKPVAIEAYKYLHKLYTVKSEEMLPIMMSEKRIGPE